MIPGITVISLLHEPLKVQRREGYTGMAIIQQASRHTVWECKYHIVFIPKYRRKILYGGIKKYLGDIFLALARQKEIVI